MRNRGGKKRMDYVDLGCGPTIVFIHERSCGPELREELSDALVEAGYRVILLPLGAPPEGIDPAASAREAVALLNYLGIGRAVVFGIGVGGCVLLELVQNYPERVAASSLVLGPEVLEKIQGLAGLGELRDEQGVEEFKRGLMAALAAQGPPCAAMNPLRAWVARVRSGSLPRWGRKKGALLSAMDLPPLLVDAETAPPRRAPRQKPQPEERINAHLSRLIAFLVPSEEEGDEEEILSGPA